MSEHGHTYGYPAWQQPQPQPPDAVAEPTPGSDPSAGSDRLGRDAVSPPVLGDEEAVLGSPPEPAPVTGHPAVDAALRGLAEVAGADPAEQLPAFHAAHRAMREALATIDEEG